jgi:hypothetical protein
VLIAVTGQPQTEGCVTQLIEVVEIGKQLLITRGATTFSIANDLAKYFAIIPADLRRRGDHHPVRRDFPDRPAGSSHPGNLMLTTLLRQAAAGLRLLLVMTAVCGLAYPLAIYGVSRLPGL